jgi:hypothetical protein
MPWNWELPEWPNFSYDTECLVTLERQFLLEGGKATGFIKTIPEKEFTRFVVEILSLERESLQSSIRRHFGLQDEHPNEGKKEAGMADLLCDVYATFDNPLTHEMLWKRQ